MLKNVAVAFVLAASIALPPAAAVAATSVDVNTGRGGTLGGTDSTWTVTGPGVPLTQASIPTAVHPNWVYGTSNSGPSKWITPTQNGNAQMAPGQYFYTTVFTLPDLTQLTQMVISGRFWADNQVVSILLNGTPIYSQNTFNANAQEFRPANATVFSSPVGFTGFVTGSNTLIFSMFNGSAVVNPSGLNVDAAFTASAVPEPGTWMLMLLGFGAIGFAMRYRPRMQRLPQHG